MSAPKDRLDKVFAQCLQHHPEGHATYEQISARDLKPGACGYIDENGAWNKIAQMTDEAAMNMLGWTCPKDLATVEKAGKEKWPQAKTSKNLSWSSTDVDAGADVPGMQAGGRIKMEYQKAEGNGAIMMADGEVKHRRAKPLSTAVDWLAQNASSILEKFKDAQTNGIWVVTSTHVAERRVLAVLSSHQTTFSWTVEVKAADVGSIAPSSSWVRERQDGSWIEQEDKDGVVLFFCGIQWDPRRIFRKLRRQREDQKYLGADEDKGLDAIEVELDSSGIEGEARFTRFKLVPKLVGTVEDVHLKADYDSEDDSEDEEDGN
ncbi:hypothetical protein HO133_009631 [Letharia lupina]|uniref:Uncharacterized protein n=1 Tax=Letharia lupina TaxID=560253 RepID=A0A8H6CM29_9LECA|nr:uncharacterized protein HO133_009631 [Letharia lupina]KAF6225631.1 hypothetical protein HO133_009631 [Letharia lupina]